MFTREEIKTQAKAQLKGNVGMFFLCTIIYVAILTAASFIPVVGSFAGLLLGAPLTYGLIKLYLNVTYGEKPEVATLFEGFNRYGQVLLLYFLVGIFTALWSLLFIVPGIIKAMSYSMSFYILAENPDMTAQEALNESKAIMEGHKMDLFVLYLSFIPWCLLGSITLGIAYIYVTPYMSLTVTNFYHKIKTQQPTSTVSEEEVVENYQN